MPVLEEGKLLLGKNLPTKNQLTVQMTWQEGKSEGFREILRYDKETEMPYVGYEQVLSVSKCCRKHPS